jgi:ribonucleoside-diphosphate reductase alpha chain
MAKEGSTISGLMDSFALMTSIALQHGVPLQLLVDKFTHTRFEPSGFTKNPEIPMAKSIMDYIFKWLAIKFLSPDSQDEAGIIRRDGGGNEGGSSAAGGGVAAHSVRRSPGESGSDSGSKASAPAKNQNVVALNKDDKKFVKDLATPAGLPLATHIPGPKNAVVMLPERNADAPRPKTTFLAQADAPSCSDCGSIMVRNGACYKCLNCGSTSGCS